VRRHTGRFAFECYPNCYPPTRTYTDLEGLPQRSVLKTGAHRTDWLSLILSLPSRILRLLGPALLLRGQECWCNREVVECPERPWDYEA
jgi:hypothetical protein